MSRVRIRGRLAELTDIEKQILFERRPDDEGGVQDGVTEILNVVRERGDAALINMAARYDGVEIEALEVPRQLWDAAREKLPPMVRAGLERAARNIRTFHEALLPGEVTLEVEPGVVLGRRFVPLEAVGVYAPGGRAVYPSSVLMGVVPAVAAGVPEIVVCSPPSPTGLPSPEVMAAAAIGGATRLFVVGGAGAIGAMAFGTESVPRCAAIVGPGNKWVLEAKRQVAGQVMIDSPAGPSEVLVASDGTGDPRRIVGELIAQAEHDPEASVAFVTTSEELLDLVAMALPIQVMSAPRQETVEASLGSRGALLLADTRAEMMAFVEDYAAEHLALYTRDPEADLEGIRTAGTVFLGDASAVAFGDYMTGANHVLPTAGASRSFSGLSTLNFVRSFTWQRISDEGAASLAEDVATLAEAERLPAHAAAVRMRLQERGPWSRAQSAAAGETETTGALEVEDSAPKRLPEDANQGDRGTEA